MKTYKSSDLRKILSDRIKSEPINQVAESLKIAEVYLLQMINGQRDISKKVARRMGYEMMPRPDVERLFTAI